MAKPSDVIGSLAKGLRVVEAFGAEHPRLTIAEAAALTGLDRATARRCLLTLFHEGFADHDGKFFTLTPRALRLGLGALTAMPLPKIVQPWLDQLANQIGQSCSVAILDETEIVYVARAAQQRVMSIGLMPGSRLPAHATSMGRVLLADLPQATARRLIDASDLSPRTLHSLTDPEAIAKELGRVAAQGYAVNDQEIETGLRSLAVPLRRQGGPVIAALNTGMAATHDTAAQMVRVFLPALLSVQKALDRIL